MRFSFEAAFALGWRTLKARYAALLVATLAFVLIYFLNSLVVQALASLTGRPVAIFLLNAVFFLGPFSAGLFLLVLKHIRGEVKPELGTLFAGFGRYAPMVSIGVLLSLPAIPFFFVLDALLRQSGFESAQEVSAVSLLLLAALILATLWFVLRLVFAPLFCVDPARHTDLGESFRRSWQITRPPAIWTLLGLALVLWLILSVSLMLLVLPAFFFGIPLMTAVWAAAYELLVNDAASGADVAPAQAPL